MNEKRDAENALDFQSINRLNLKFGDFKLKRCKYGWMLFDSPYIGTCLDLYGEYSESEVSIFRQYVKQGDVAIDVGAFIGDLTIPLAQLVGEQGRVFAYESNAQIFNVLNANLALNQIKNVRPINAFVADRQDVSMESGEWLKYDYVGDNWEPTVAALDRLELERLDFVKIDVDGRELDVIKSGAHVIKKYRPVLYLENDIREKSKPLLEFILGLGYRIFFHAAPIFQPENFFGNPVNHWAPNNVVSLMVLALPQGVQPPSSGVTEVTSPDEWWDLS